jgi:protein-S-isoprenylcysteine O-methyltransferase Ste14
MGVSLKGFRIAFSNLFWAGGYSFWAWLNLNFLLRAHPFQKLVGLLLIVQCSSIAVFFLIRSCPRASSWNPYDIITALMGTFAPMLFIQSYRYDILGLAGVFIQVIGVVLTISSSLSLSRSWGIIPAHRGIKTDGMYRFVRHPIYASYQIFNAGFILSSFSFYNLAVAATALTCQILRIRNEERFLANDPDYFVYSAQVRWKMIPFIY